MVNNLEKKSLNFFAVVPYAPLLHQFYFWQALLVQNMIQVLADTPFGNCAGSKLKGHPVRIFFPPPNRNSSSHLSSYFRSISNFVQFWSSQEKNQLGKVEESSQLELPPNEVEQVGDGSDGPQLA